MTGSRQPPTNAVPNQSDSHIEEAMQRLEINNNQDGGSVAQSNTYPDRPGEPDCIYYLRTGLCSYGNNCRFNHPAFVSQGSQYSGELPERVGQPDCGYFLKTGTCKYGATCKFHHPRDRRGAGPVSFNILGLPMREEEKSCPFYTRTGSCKFGPACKFHHPQPAAVGTMLPVAGSTDFGSLGAAVLPSSSLTYSGGLSTWSLPRAPYVTGPHVQGPQTYMPVLLSPQGILSPPGWNTYMGNMSPVSPTTILGFNLMYNFKNRGESCSSGQISLLSNSSSNLPERPDQPECRYFMNNGTCKHGADCKYHHPRERIANSAGNPLGLPSRPGQAVCSYYSMYGLCKYGPTCIFDHPIVANPYNYSLNSLPSIFDASLLSYARSFPTAAHAYEMSHSLSSNSLDVVQKRLNSKHHNSDAGTFNKQAGSLPHSPSSSGAFEDKDKSG